MRTKTLVMILVALVLSSFALAADMTKAGEVGQHPVSMENKSCISCHADTHKDVVDAWQKSMHAKVGVSCSTCHATDAGDVDAKSASFIAKPSIETCNSCHAKETADYVAKKHAKFTGKTQPTCYECHGKHEFTKPGATSASNKKDRVNGAGDLLAIKE